MEKLLSDLLKMSHMLCYKVNDKEAHVAFEAIKNKFSTIKNKYDVNMIRASDPNRKVVSYEDIAV